MERFAASSSATVSRALLLLVLTATAGLAANNPDTVRTLFTATTNAGTPEPPAIVTPPLEFVRLLPGVPRPVSIAVASDGRILVTDNTTPLAKAFLPDGTEVALKPAARDPGEPSSFPFGVAVDEAGDVYVSDLIRNEVLVYRAGSLEPSPFAGPEWGGRAPGALFARDGRLYVADIRNQQIVVIDIAEERRVSVIGTGQGDGPTEMRYPNGVWVDTKGVVYVSDSNNDRIQRFTADGRPLSSWPGFRNPRGIAGDGNGRIFVANTLAHEILIIDNEGGIVSRVVRAGSREIGFPTGLAVAGNRLLVTDRDAHGVYEWRLTDERRAP